MQGELPLIEIISIAVLFVISLVANAIITKWSAKRVLGLDLTNFSASLVVIGRSLAALLAGFSIGYAIRLGFLPEVEGDLEYIKLAMMLFVACLSFLAYWALLGRVSKTRISFLGMAKTVATETVMLVVSVVGVSLVISSAFFLFS